jgi:hypothetical protein
MLRLFHFRSQAFNCRKKLALTSLYYLVFYLMGIYTLLHLESAGKTGRGLG